MENIKDQILKIPEINENVNRIYKNFWETAIEVVRKKGNYRVNKFKRSVNKRNCLFTMLNKIGKLLVKLLKRREKTQTKLKNESGNITPDSTEISRIIRDYYQLLYNYKFDNLEETDTFLTVHLPSREK
jgi:DNA gyrase/topoisomerase IV subunit A